MVPAVSFTCPAEPAKCRKLRTKEGAGTSHRNSSAKKAQDLNSRKLFIILSPIYLPESNTSREPTN